jgi:hypothetical protein
VEDVRVKSGGVTRSNPETPRPRGRYIVPLAAVMALATGCASASPYREPVAKFQTGVNTTTEVVRPYLVRLNEVENASRLYGAVKEKKDWGTEHLAPVFRPAAIRVRLDALALVAKYAALLGDLADSKAPEALEKAAGDLGKNANALLGDLGKLGGEGGVPNLTEPLTALVNLGGQIAIERKRGEALEKAVLSGEQPIAKIIDLLQKDLTDALALEQTAFAKIQTVRLEMYNQARTSASPGALIAMMDEIIRVNAKMQVIETLRVGPLMAEMQEAHQALVAFARSSKSPKDLNDLAARIDVFATHAVLVAKAITALRDTE